MSLPPGLESTTGAQKLYDWFGYWPKFHDAQVISLRIGLTEPTSLIIHAWHMTDQVNPEGYYELVKHVVVEFMLGDVLAVNLQDFFGRSILFDLEIAKTDGSFRLDLSSSYGLSGTIQAKALSIRLTPGKPSAAT